MLACFLAFSEWLLPLTEEMSMNITENLLANNLTQYGRYKKFSVVTLDGKVFCTRPQRIIFIEFFGSTRLQYCIE
jgi:hypothetical protein